MEQKTGFGGMEEKAFMPIYDYVMDDSVTDIDFDGKDLWIIRDDNSRQKGDASLITDEYLNKLADKMATRTKRPFNAEYQVLEAETENLRVTMVHESAAVSGRVFCIRKSLPGLRFTAEQAIGENMYCSKEILALLINLVLAKSNIVFCGEPRHGKTECAKFLSQYIPADQKVITIEDTPEWHYKEINPGKNGIELKVNPFFDYTKAIKTCMRLNPDWIMLSEARSTEVKSLLEAFSTGVKGFTTLHTDDVRKVPDRMMNMMQNTEDSARVINDIYEFLDVGVLLREVTFPDKKKRKVIDQVGIYERTEKENRVYMILENQKIMDSELPEQLMKHLKKAGITKPYENVFLS